MKIGLNIVCTGKYDIFFEPLLRSIERYFFYPCEINIYLFTDKNIEYKTTDRITINRITIEHKPFPHPTLFRYKHFIGHGDYDCDYLFYLDVDMRIVGEVGVSILPGASESVTAVIHPGFYKGGGSWCTNKESKAYTENNNVYYAGGFQGGITRDYLNACKEMADSIDINYSKGIIDEWHDESMWNYYLSNKNHKILTPSYCYPEKWAIPFEKKILALDKDHIKIRSLK